VYLAQPLRGRHASRDRGQTFAVARNSL